MFKLNKVIIYSTQIFISLGLEENSWAVYAAIFLSFVETVMHVVSMFLMDKKGRRFLLLVGLSGMSLSCFILALTRFLLVISQPFSFCYFDKLIAFREE